MTDQPIWFYIGPEVVEKLPTIPVNAEMVPLDHILVNEMIGDILMGPLYSESDSEPDGCYRDCYDMRTESTAYQSILNQSQNQAVGGAIADGALATPPQVPTSPSATATDSLMPWTATTTQVRGYRASLPARAEIGA